MKGAEESARTVSALRIREIGNAEKAAALIGFAVKKGAVLLGADNVLAARKRPYAVVFNGVSAGTLAKVERFCAAGGIPLYQSGRPVEDIVHKTNCKIVGITDRDIADGIAKGCLSG